MIRLIGAILGIFPFLLYGQVSIYDIQYTTEEGDGSYPSLYANQVVTTGGIVTANNFPGGRYFISSSQGGAWNGLFIYDNTNSCEVGDSILLTGLVFEYNGRTEMKDITSFDVISTGNPLPEPLVISTAAFADEPYEGVLVTMQNCWVSEPYDEYANFVINDGSGDCQIRSGLHNLSADGFPLFEYYEFASVSGLIWDYYGICFLPRTIDDYQSAGTAFVLSTNNMKLENDNVFNLPIKISLLNQTANISNYSIQLNYNAEVFHYNGSDVSGTLSASGTISDNSTEGNIVIDFSGNVTVNHTNTLINLSFNPIAVGEGDLAFTAVIVNDEPTEFYAAGELISESIGCLLPQADTLTIVQSPVLNIPSILTKDELLTIECFAPAATEDWEAQLFYNEITVDLTIAQANYNSQLDKWTLQANLPDVEFYELYDLVVTASDGIVDTVRNAVKIIEAYKPDYYFIQITDTHLPGHTFWGDYGYQTDATELADLEEVINDINLLNPEFVLITGDLLNEGEMEDFECLRHHTQVVKLLEKFEVPVYIVPGNHDLGGWPDTPPEQGTARQEWWRFFGWRQREIQPVITEFYVHDYSFDYGDVRYMGMESSDNYDGYMHDVYGDMGFIPSQLTWLDEQLNAAEDKTTVLFYHFDFNGDLDLNALGIDMALWGHIHSNVDDFTHPYSIATDNVCDGTQAYRIIHVNNNDLTPEYTSYTKNNGEQNVSINFSHENNGSQDSLTATLSNKHNIEFSNALVRFIMPQNETGYTVYNGTLQQQVGLDGKVLCYVSVDLAANSDVVVSIAKNEPDALKQAEAQGSLGMAFPNPFKEQIQMNFTLKAQAKVKLTIYNSSGQQVKTLIDDEKSAGEYKVYWDGKNSRGNLLEAGAYYYKFSVDGKQLASRQMFFMP